MRLQRLIAASLLAAALTGCGRKDNAPAAEIAVSNSYLYAVVRDLCGDETVIFSIVPPGMCPGHFDIRPSDVRRLYGCRVLLAFDFQQAIGNILPENGGGPSFHTIAAPAGMCIPETYLSMTRRTAEILSAEYPERQAHFQTRLEAIAERMATLENECFRAARAMGLADAAALTSRHQAAFAEWLGIEVLATFSGRDAETAANINAALHASGQRPLRWIIANRQEGAQLAEAMAERLGVPAVMFSNFPAEFAESMDAPAFDALVRDNLRRLAEAGQ